MWESPKRCLTYGLPLTGSAPKTMTWCPSARHPGGWPDAEVVGSQRSWSDGVESLPEERRSAGGREANRRGALPPKPGRAAELGCHVGVVGPMQR